GQKIPVDRMRGLWDQRAVELVGLLVQTGLVWQVRLIGAGGDVVLVHHGRCPSETERRDGTRSLPAGVRADALRGGLLRHGRLAAGAVDVVAGAGEVVADSLRHELLGLDYLALRRGPVVLTDVALGDELVTLGEASVSAFSGLAERDEVVEGRLGL